MKNKKHKIMAEEITAEIPEGVDEAPKDSAFVDELVAEFGFSKEAVKLLVNVDVKCSSSNRDASYDSKAQQLTITQNGITIMVSPCKTENQAIKLAAKF